jgi:23S rRNA pseudouridine1911/1915/1917 synthase
VEFLVTEEDSGKRLDVWLAGRAPDISRSRIQSLIADGHVSVSGRRVKPGLRVAPGMVAKVEVPEPKSTGLQPEDIPLDILHEDGDLVVVNKPPGMVVHPAAGHSSGTLVNALLHRCPDLRGIGGELRPGIVHRLDKDTSGALVVAKTDAAMARLAADFHGRRIRKEYLAIVHGRLPDGEQRIETEIGRSGHDRKRMSARPPGRGRKAVTHVKAVEELGDFTLVRVRIETGRTHQIRVHMAFVGHPVAGDRQYGGRRERAGAGRFPRQMLHAETLAFAHPSTGGTVSFRAPIPADFASALAGLRAAPDHGCGRASPRQPQPRASRS